MKYIIFTVFIFLMGCQSPGNNSITIYDNLGIFHPLVNTTILDNACETSLTSNISGQMVMYADVGMVGSFDLIQNGNIRHLADGMRFSYVFRSQYNGVWYAFYNVDNDIYLRRSYDGITFFQMNGGRPVLTHQAGTIYEHVWNVGVAIDDSGVWHMLIECQGPFSIFESNLGYSHATMAGDNLDFDANKSPSYVILNGGSPDLKYLPGRGFLITYAPLNQNNVWYIRMATADPTFTTISVSSNFYLAYLQVHLADPSLFEYGGYTYLTASYNQTAIYEWRTGGSLAQIFDTVNVG
jgi:hypothetical protein